jgi:hypothetical protein
MHANAYIIPFCYYIKEWNNNLNKKLKTLTSKYFSEYSSLGLPAPEELQKLNKHAKFLFENLESVNINHLLGYGVQNLQDRDLIDDDLATYFLLLSELRNIPDAAASLSIDLMLYCETGADELIPENVINKAAALAEYEKIKTYGI